MRAGLENMNNKNTVPAGPVATVFASLCLLVCAGAAQADFYADIGYTRLQAEYGDRLPATAGFPVMMVESDRDNDPDVLAFAPDAAEREFAGIRITVGENGPGVYAPYSSHATSVGKLFFGNESAVAPAIDRVASYLTDDWYSSRFLRLNDARQPKRSVSRVVCHAWVGLMTWQNDTFNPLNTGTLRRVDWLAHIDESVHVAGFAGTDKTPLIGDAFNVIAVINTDNEERRGTLAIDSNYLADRQVPHLVVPEDSPSAATGRAASAAALLVAVAHQTPALSNGETRNRAGMQIYNAERSEVIRSSLFAGASRLTENSTSDDVEAYRQRPEDRAQNGMDRRFGAGQLNVYHSYRILTGGEQDSREDNPAADMIGAHGFDYDASFGGLADSNRRASYRFATGDSGGRLTAALTWNIDIRGGTPLNFNPAARLHDLDLALYDITVGEPVLVIASRSRRDNSENIRAALEPGRTYEIVVVPGPGYPDFEWDYALAWRLDPSP